MELGYLSELVEVNLQNNAITGELPAQLGDLSNLQYLGLSSNQLSGTIPAPVGHLHNLGKLSPLHLPKTQGG